MINTDDMLEETFWKSKSLYVGDLSRDVTDAELEEVFEHFGELESVKVCRDWKSGLHLGYGFVNFTSMASAARALREFNYRNIKGKPCRLMWSTKRSIGAKKEDDAANVFVRNLSGNVDNRTLHSLFEPFGPILSVKVVVNEIGESLGYGYVSFTSHKSATDAIREMNGRLLDGVRIAVEPYLEKTARNASMTGSKIFVGDIPKFWTEFHLRRRFEIYGTILSADLITSANGKNRGFAFVVFSTERAAALAVMDSGLPKEELLWGDEVFNVSLRVEISSGKKKQDDIVYPPTRSESTIFSSLPTSLFYTEEEDELEELFNAAMTPFRPQQLYA